MNKSNYYKDDYIFTDFLCFEKEFRNLKNYQHRYFALIANLFIYFDKEHCKMKTIGFNIIGKYNLELFISPGLGNGCQIKKGIKSVKNYIFTVVSQVDLKVNVMESL